MRFLNFIFLFSFALCRASDFQEVTTKLTFPEKCDSWTRTRVDEDARKTVGVSVAYSIKNGSTVTCRIFDGQFGPPRDNSEAIQKEMSEIAAGIVAVWQRLGATVEMLMPPSPIPSDKNQFVMVHRITHPKQSTVSITFFRFYEGRYLSFRFSTPEQDTTAAFNELGRFLKALKESRKVARLES